MVSAVTGALFIFGQPDQYFYNNAFKVKVVCLALLGLNVCAFYALEARQALALGAGDDAPLRAKVFAAISLTLLVAIMCAGRMLTFYGRTPVTRRLVIACAIHMMSAPITTSAPCSRSFRSRI